MTIDTALTHAGMLIGGIVGGAAVGAVYVRRLFARGIDSQAIRELHVVEAKNNEAHRQFDERLRVIEMETSRQQGTIEQINERLGEILGLLRNGRRA